MWVDLAQSVEGLCLKKKKIHRIRGSYTGLTAFQTKIPAFILPLSLN